MDQKNYNKALECYKQALKVNPGDPYPLGNYLVLNIQQTGDLLHIVIWDFDVKGLSYLYHITRELVEVQKMFNLSDIYLFKSRNGFNAICLDKHNSENTLKIKMETKHSCPQHNRIGYKRDSWVLRLDNDKRLMEIIYNNGVWKKSNAHRLLINKYFNMNVAKDDDFDNYTTLRFEKYLRVKK